MPESSYKVFFDPYDEEVQMEIDHSAVGDPDSGITINISTSYKDVEFSTDNVSDVEDIITHLASLSGLTVTIERKDGK